MAGMSICRSDQGAPERYQGCECGEKAEYQCLTCAEHLCAEHVVCAGPWDYCSECIGRQRNEHSITNNQAA